jgi:7-carboxy-7-deazaguanine synthase
MKLRVAEIFGPTIQGEGRHVGVPCHFIRLGGCDYTCAWCDSLHAVLPEHTKLLPRMTESEILVEILKLQNTVEWVVISGGNPALFNLGLLVEELHDRMYRVMVETQGTLYKPWLINVDELCVSPKGPSANIGTPGQSLTRLKDFMACQGIRNHKSIYLKVPIFSSEDYDFAREVHATYPEIEMFLSTGNALPPRPGNITPTSRPMLRTTLLQRTEELVKKVISDPHMSDVRVFPQQHVLLWGNDRGR